MVTKLDLDDDIFGQVVPLIFVLSDARGETANTVVMAAAAQFGDGSVDIERLSNVKDVDTARFSTRTTTRAARAPCSTRSPTARCAVRSAASSTAAASPPSTCSARPSRSSRR